MLTVNPGMGCFEYSIHYRFAGKDSNEGDEKYKEEDEHLMIKLVYFDQKS